MDCVFYCDPVGKLDFTKRDRNMGGVGGRWGGVGEREAAMDCVFYCDP